MDIRVPWNAAWTGEHRYEVRNCRYAGGRPAIWQPFQPGDGKPMFAAPHMVRQRKSIAEMRCTVCGEKTPEDDRWWFRLGHGREGWLMTTEAPVHRRCADYALTVCPHLRGREADLEPLPTGYSILRSLVGGPQVGHDFGIVLTRPVVGNLKIAWPVSRAWVKDWVVEHHPAGVGK